MTMIPTKAMTAREPRFQIKKPCSVQIIVTKHGSQADGDPVTETFLGQLIDVSRCGAKIVVPACVAMLPTYHICLDIVEIDVRLELSAETCWSKLDKKGGWIIGCNLSPCIPGDIFERLFVSGHLERRSYPRHTLSREARVSWELGISDSSASLVDFSSSGFSMRSPEAGEVGQRLQLIVPNGDRPDEMLTAKVQWRVKLNYGYLVGCALTGPFNIERLFDKQEAPSDAQPERSFLGLPEPLQPFKPALISAATTLALGLGAGLLFSGSSGTVDDPQQDQSAVRESADSAKKSEDVRRQPASDLARQSIEKNNRRAP